MILKEVKNERTKQNIKWGVQDHNAVEWIAILTEEVGEASTEAVDFHFENGSTDDPEYNHHMQQERLRNYRKECIQVAAVAVQMVESLDRQTDNEFNPLIGKHAVGYKPQYEFIPTTEEVDKMIQLIECLFDSTDGESFLMPMMLPLVKEIHPEDSNFWNDSRKEKIKNNN